MTSVAVAIAGHAIDPALVVADVTIRSGRSRSDDALSASSATIDLVTPDPAGVSVSIADALVVTVDGRPRFTGKVSEIQRATLDDPNSSTYTIVGIGPIGRLPRVQIPLPLAATNARARAAAILSTAGIPAVLEGGDTYALAAYGTAGDPPAGADQILSALMNDTGAIAMDLGDGSVLVQFLDSRLSDEAWTPDPDRTHVDLEWEMTDDLVNDITVEWPGGATVNSSSTSSVSKYGRLASSLSTGLGSLGAAQQRATSIIARLAFPAWRLGKVETWDPGVMDHQIGAVVTIAPLPASSPITGSAWEGVLEGWTDHYGPDADGILSGTWELALSDRQHSSEGLAWQNVSPPTLKWNQVNPETSWSEAVSNGDLT